MNKHLFNLMILLIVTFSDPAIGQEKLESESPFPNNTVYLQTDKGRYFHGEDIWFKGTVMDAKYLFPSTLDTILYVQLRAANNPTVLKQILLPIKSGFAEGNISIEKNIPFGVYYLCAFTQNSFDKRANIFRAYRTIIIGNASYQKSPPTNQSLQFIYEGGNLVEGMPNHVVFKHSLTSSSEDHFEGILLEDEKVITHIKSNKLGMGSFYLQPKPNKKYSVRDKNNNEVTPLPPIQKSGIVLRKIKQDSTEVSFLVSKSPDFKAKTIQATVHLRGVKVGEMQRAFTRDSLRITIPTKVLPQGILNLSLTDEAGLHLAERSVYINPSSKLNVQVEGLQEDYSAKELVQLKISVKDAQGQPVQALLSASVFDKALESPIDNGHIASFGYGENLLSTDNSAEALDLQLIARKKQKVADSFSPYLPNVIRGQIEMKKGTVDYLVPVQASNGKISTPVKIDREGRFSLDSEILDLGRVYLKLIGTEETIGHVKWKVPDPFTLIEEAMKKISFNSYTSTTQIPGLRGNISLNEVTIKGRGTAKAETFLAQLDSLSKYNFNNDYVGKCNWLNCGDCASGTKPVEGVRYARYRDGRIPRHGAFDSKDVIQEPYVYPKYTEEELIKKYNLFKMEGFPTTKEFYSPDYAVELKNVPDARTTLYWNPAFLTDENGEAILRFYTSDLSGAFVGKIEGITASGLLGHSNFVLEVQNELRD